MTNWRIRAKEEYTQREIEEQKYSVNNDDDDVPNVQTSMGKLSVAIAQAKDDLKGLEGILFDVLEPADDSCEKVINHRATLNKACALRTQINSLTEEVYDLSLTLTKLHDRVQL